MNFQAIYVGIATNDNILLNNFNKIDEEKSTLVFLSRIDYSTVNYNALYQFCNLYRLIPREDDLKFSVKNQKNEKYTLLSSIILKNLYFEAEMNNYSKYIITNFPIINNNINLKKSDNWIKKYDGKLGYIVSQHYEPEDVKYYNYAASINHNGLQKIDGKNTNTIIKL